MLALKSVFHYLRPSEEECFGENAEVTQIYFWITISLLISSFIAFFCDFSDAIKDFLSDTSVIVGSCIASLTMIMLVFFWMYISTSFYRLAKYITAVLFCISAVINAVMLSSVFLLCTTTSAVATFFSIAGLFGVMTFYGRTGHDLSQGKSFVFMGIIGLCLMSLVNLLIGSEEISYVVNLIGILLVITYGIVKFLQFLIPYDI